MEEGREGEVMDVVWVIVDDFWGMVCRELGWMEEDGVEVFKAFESGVLLRGGVLELGLVWLVPVFGCELALFILFLSVMMYVCIDVE